MRKIHRVKDRAQHGKYWDPIFFQRRGTADYPLAEQCQSIFGSRTDDNENGRNDNKEDGGNTSKDYVVKDEKVIEGKRKTDNSTARVGTTNSSANPPIKSQRYQGQEIDVLFNDPLSHMFLGDWDASITTWEAKVVRRFFSCAEDEALVKADNTAWAWLDDREYSTGHRRRYQRSMNATDLCSALRQNVVLPFVLDVIY